MRSRWMCARSEAVGLETARVAIVVDEAVEEAAAEVDIAGLLGWLDEVLATDFAGRGSLTLSLQGDAGIADLNRRFRGKQGATDVLSFPGDPADPEPYLGDIAVSLETAARQAEREGHSLAAEVRLLALHGTLHCLGFDHEVDDGEMVGEELALRRRWLGEGDDA